MSKLIIKFSDKIPQLSYLEKHVFYYLDSNIKSSSNLSLTTLANVNNVSTTTIIRMCTKLGLHGFSELRYLLKQLEEECTPINNIELIKNNFIETINNINLDSIKILANHIKKANKVIIISVGLTKPIGEYFSKLLMQDKKNSIYIYESHMIDLLYESVHVDDLIIFISNSGETKTLITFCEKLSHKTITLSAIINSYDSTLSKLVDIPIHSNTKKINISGYDVTPRSTLLIMIDILFSYYLE